MPVFKVISGRWRDISQPAEPLDAIQEIELVKKFNQIYGDNPLFDRNAKLSQDKVSIAINLADTSELQDDIFSRCLELNDHQLNLILAYIKQL